MHNADKPPSATNNTTAPDYGWTCGWTDAPQFVLAEVDDEAAAGALRSSSRRSAWRRGVRKTVTTRRTGSVNLAVTQATAKAPTVGDARMASQARAGR